MRKTSMGQQLSRTARRFSAVVAPQLAKIDPVMVLQKYSRLQIRITDITKLQEAMKQYVLHGGKMFDPVEFEIRAEDEGSESAVILTASFFAEEIVLFDGQKRLLSICLNDPSEADLLNRFNTSGAPITGDTQVLAKVRHPISGMKLFEVTQNKNSGNLWQITSAMDEFKCYVEAHSNIWRQALSACGFMFAAEWWSVEHEGVRVGQVCPHKSMCEENSLHVEWKEHITNEFRILTLCFGLIQTIREAFPTLMHIVRESRQRKMHIQPTTP